MPCLFPHTNWHWWTFLHSITFLVVQASNQWPDLHLCLTFMWATFLHSLLMDVSELEGAESKKFSLWTSITVTLPSSIRLKWQIPQLGDGPFGKPCFSKLLLPLLPLFFWPISFLKCKGEHRSGVCKHAIKHVWSTRGVRRAGKKYYIISLKLDPEPCLMELVGIAMSGTWRGWEGGITKEEGVIRPRRRWDW